MNQPTIQEGELLAYLDGEPLPHVEAALRESAALREELERLRRLDRWLRDALAGKTLPDPQDLVDVAAGQATPAQRLLVAAWTRRDAAARRELAALQAEAQRLAAASRPRRARLPRFIALPLAAALGVRELDHETPGEQTFYAAELQAQVTLRVAPLPRERWRIEGYVTQQHAPAPGLKVRLTSSAAHPRPRTTDAAGFFAFGNLAPGVYTLNVYFAQGHLIVPDILLNDD